MDRILPGFLALCMSGSLLAQSAGQAGSFLRIGLGPRARAMGDAYSAVADRAVGPFYNPAGLGFIRVREASVSASAMSFDRTFNFIGFVSPLPPSAGYGMGLLQSGFRSYEGRSSNGEPTGQQIEDTQYAVFMGFAIRFTDQFAAGITPTWMYSKVFDVSSTSLGTDIGFMYKPLAGLSLAYSIHQMFQDFNYVRDPSGLGDQTTQDKLPRVTRYGISYARAFEGTVKGVLVAADLEKTQKQSTRIHLGTEINILNKIFFRSGLDASDLAVGLGIPIQWRDHRFLFDYAFIRDCRSGLQFGSHDFSLSYLF